MYEEDDISFWVHIWAPYCSYHVNFTNVDPQIVCKMPDFSTLSALGKRMLCSKERYPLLSKCFITFIRCMRKPGGAPDSICKRLLVHTVSFLPRMTLPYFIQNARFYYPLSTGKRMLCSKERYPLLLKCFITFLRWISNTWGAPGSICEPLLVQTVPFLSRMTPKFHTKCQIWGTPSALET